jgi:hypothetical protein
MLESRKLWLSWKIGGFPDIELRFVGQSPSNIQKPPGTVGEKEVRKYRGITLLVSAGAGPGPAVAARGNSHPIAANVARTPSVAIFIS